MAPAWIQIGLHFAALIIEVLGVSVILLGIFSSILTYLFKLKQTTDWSNLYYDLRISLARGILLGLEFLVAADIIGTVAIAPSRENLYTLGLIVLIRTFLSFALETEIEGQWPWQRSRSKD